MAQTHIVLAEDDQRLAKLMANYLTQHEFTVTRVSHGDQVQQRVLREQPDLLILDIMLPGQDGFTICRQLRQQFQGPILILTARQDDIDQVLGFELGADDYVMKPIEPRVLLARVQALLRRAYPGNRQEQQLRCGQLVLQQQAQRAYLGDTEVSLTSHEFELLWYLARHPGQVVTREQIHRELIGRPYDGLDRTVDMRISQLRRKLNDDLKQPVRLKTVWGKGYLFVPDTWG